MANPDPFMPWEPRFETGLPEVDRQHRVLVDLLNRAALCVQTGEGAEVELLFNELHTYAGQHFAFEEEFLKRTAYPDFEAHHREHLGFRNHLAGLYAAYLGQSTGGAMELTGFLRAWLEHHILNSDRAYVPHVVNHADA